MTRKDRRKRNHIVLNDNSFYELLKKEARKEGMPLEQYLKKHVEVSEYPDSDLLQDYQRILNELTSRYELQDKQLKELGSYYWFNLIGSAKGILDINRLFINAKAEYDSGLYKKKRRKEGEKT